MKIDRVLLPKYLYQNGKEFLERDDPYAFGLAVSLFQDAAESLLFYIALHLGEFKKPYAFLDYWHAVKVAPKNKDKKDLPLRLQMEQLNRDRVDFKHYGNLPAAVTARDHALNTEEFLRKSMDIFLGVDFDILSKADLIVDSRAKELIKNAEKYYRESDYRECIAECAKADKVVTFSIHEAFFKGRPAPQLRLTTTGNKIIDKNFHQLAQYFRQLNSTDVTFAVVVALQIRMADYVRFYRIIPVVLGPAGDSVQISHKRFKYSQEEADFCLKYVTDVALLTQNRI
jgi:hypothetical protein